jgi:hypothetical protein
MLRLPAQRDDDAPASAPLALRGDEALAELVSRARTGVRAEEAFAALDRILRPWLIAYYQRASFSHADADELVQNALSRVYLGIRGLLEEARFLPWLALQDRPQRQAHGAGATAPVEPSLRVGHGPAR